MNRTGTEPHPSLTGRPSPVGHSVVRMKEALRGTEREYHHADHPPRFVPLRRGFGRPLCRRRSGGWRGCLLWPLSAALLLLTPATGRLLSPAESLWPEGVVLVQELQGTTTRWDLTRLRSVERGSMPDKGDDLVLGDEAGRQITVSVVTETTESLRRASSDEPESSAPAPTCSTPGRGACCCSTSRSRWLIGCRTCSWRRPSSR